VYRITKPKKASRAQKRAAESLMYLCISYDKINRLFPCTALTAWSRDAVNFVFLDVMYMKLRLHAAKETSSFPVPCDSADTAPRSYRLFFLLIQSVYSNPQRGYQGDQGVEGIIILKLLEKRLKFVV
jgi:hypothetical protein